MTLRQGAAERSIEFGRSHAENTSAPHIIVLDADDSKAVEWNGYVNGSAEAELYHDYRWRSLIETLFAHESYYFMAIDEIGAVRGVLPLVRLRSRLFGDFLVSLPYFNYCGVIADSKVVLMALLNHAKRCARMLGVAHIELRHRDVVLSDWRARADKVTMRLDLPEFEETLWEGFKAKLRSQIRRPQKEGAKTRIGGVELVDDFYRVFARNMRDLGTPVYPKRFFEAILEVFHTEASVHIVDLDDKPAAAALVLGHRSTLEIPWASSVRQTNRVGANMLLYWSVLRYAIYKGYQCFDFGRSSSGSGTYRFKQQWGAQPEQLHWHYWLRDGAEIPQITPSNAKYRAAIALWRKLPVPMANLLGPHIVKNLP